MTELTDSDTLTIDTAVNVLAEKFRKDGEVGKWEIIFIRNLSNEEVEITVKYEGKEDA